MNAKLILLQKVDSLGKRGDIVEVAKGYARNFLLPQNLAKVVNQKDINKIEQEKEAQKVKIQEQLAKLKDIGQRLAKRRILISKRASSTGKLYGAISAQEISKAIYQTYGFLLPKESIRIEPIKSLGLHPFKIILPDIEEVLMKAKIVDHAI